MWSSLEKSTSDFKIIHRIAWAVLHRQNDGLKLDIQAEKAFLHILLVYVLELASIWEN